MGPQSMVDSQAPSSRGTQGPSAVHSLCQAGHTQQLLHSPAQLPSECLTRSPPEPPQPKDPVPYNQPRGCSLAHPPPGCQSTQQHLPASPARVPMQQSTQGESSSTAHPVPASVPGKRQTLLAKRMPEACPCHPPATPAPSHYYLASSFHCCSSAPMPAPHCQPRQCRSSIPEGRTRRNYLELTQREPSKEQQFTTRMHLLLFCFPFSFAGGLRGCPGGACLEERDLHPCSSSSPCSESGARGQIAKV